MLLLALAARVAADPVTDAERAFQRGRALMRTHRYVEACAAFEDSQRLDPQLGTLFNLANCDVEIGKLASAWRIYRELATSDPNADRKALSGDLARQLERRLPKLVVVTPTPPPGLAISIDDVASPVPVGVETPVDVGEHTVTVMAPGFQKHIQTFAAKEKALAKLTVTLTPLDATQAPPAIVKTRDVETSPRARYGKIAVIGGGTVVAAGLVVGAVAVSQWHDAQKAMGSDATTKSHRAVVLGNVSTAMVLIGLIPTGIGVYLWRTSGSAAVVIPQLGVDQAGVSILGKF